MSGNSKGPGLSFLRTAHRVARTIGVDPQMTLHASRGLAWFVRDLIEFRRRAGDGDSASFPFGSLHPCLVDRSAESGDGSGHYFHQDLLVARRVFARAPERHVDVGSRIDGFVAHVASFREIDVLDIRPLARRIPNVRFHCTNVMELDPAFAGMTDSLSCLHALEHFGLGRYGDPIDPDGHLAGLAALHSLLRPGGRLYLSVPIGPQRVEFNAHRVFSVPYLLRIVQQTFDVETFSFVDDAGDLHEDVAMTQGPVERNFDCVYGCGILELRRR